MGGQHLGVVHDLALVGGDLQRGQHIIHTRQAGGRACRGAVEAPLEDVEAGPARYVGALFERRMNLNASMQRTENKDKQKFCRPSSLSHLHTLSLPAGECFLHHAVVLSQHPVPVYQLGVNGPEGCDGVGSEGVFLGRLWGSLGVVDVENHISFGHVKVPGDDGGGFSDLDQHLPEDVKRLETQNSRQQVVNHLSHISSCLQYIFLPAGGSLIHGIKSSMGIN